MTGEGDSPRIRVTDRQFSASETVGATQAGREAHEHEHEDEHEREGTAGGAPEIDFVTFVMSLARSAMVGIGALPDPETGKPERNLPLARQTIDILGILQEKTRGNLTGEEERILDSVLYDLRMTYVTAAGAPEKTG
ncbi:MAG: DUF1844 domain-containing protein [Myxococcota bacterium]|nr:DUF1844 domain-containing protein [Myxococcota bacterium]